VALPIFGHLSVVFAAVGSISTLGNSPFGADYTRPVHSRTYASPRALLLASQGSLPAARARFAGRDFHPQDDETEFQGFIVFLLSVLPFLVAPHVGDAVAAEVLINAAIRECPRPRA
jgi:hypothetical protein